MDDPQRMSRTLIEVKFIPRERCDNCRTRSAVVTVIRTHTTIDFDPSTEVAGAYIRKENLCQPCANEVVREESCFLDTIVDDGKEMFVQSKVCLNEKLDSIGQEEAELCGCRDCIVLLDLFPED